jgi:hypothetical protein
VLTGSVSITGSLAVNGTTATLGTGTINTVPKFTSANIIGNSNITDSGTLITLGSLTRLTGAGTFSTDTTVDTGDAVLISSVGATPGTGAFGSGLVFGGVGIGTNPRRAAIVPVMSTTSADTDRLGLAFFTHPSATGTDPMLEMMRLDPNGSLGIGTTNLTGYSLRVSKNITGATTSYGITSDGQIQSGVTGIAYLFSTNTSTQATSFTLTNIVHYNASLSSLGAGSSVTNQFGFLAENTMIGATNNYGFFGNLAAATGRWNLYMNGTAPNYLAGQLGIGKLPSTGTQLDVLGATILSGSLTVFTGSGIEFQVTNTGVKIGNAITDTHTVTGSINISGSITATNLTGSLFGTSSFAVTSSFVTASNVFGPFGSNSVISASFALSASHAPNALTASFAISASQAISSSYATFALSASNAPGFTTNFSQSTAATTWSFNHNLNTRNPLVQVYSPTFAQIIPNEIVGIDAFTVEVRFDYAQAGYAVASNGGGLYVTGSTPRLVQTVAATTWSFQHNLGTKYPGYEVYDSNDNVIVPAGIRSVNINNAEIYFAFPTTGVAIANFSGISGSLDNAISSSYAATASYADTFTIDQTLIDYATVVSSINGSNTIFTQATGSYTSAFFKYTITSASNARSGEVISVWNGTSVRFTDTSTTDIGTTSAATSSVVISGGNVLFNVQTNTAGWRIKSMGTFI